MAKKLMAWFGFLALVVAGCGPAATPTSAPVAQATPAPGTTAVPTAAPTRAPTAPAATGPQELVYAAASWGQENLDPTISSLPWDFTGPLWDLPVGLTPEGELSPRYATSWEQSADGLSWTLKLRQGIKFHDGQEMTAEDVKFSLEGVARPEARASRTALFRTAFESIDVVDPYTIRIKTRQPWVTLVYDLSTHTGSESIVLPKHYIERVGWKEFNSKPIGTGPGKFVQHRAGNLIEFDANKDFYLYKPEFDRFRFVLIPDLSTRIAMLRMGQADISKITLTTVPEVEKTGLKTVSDPQPLSLRIHFYGTHLPEAGPTYDVRVRQAMNLAIDRQEMVDAMFYGRGEPAAVFPAGKITLGFPAELKPYPYDPARARELMAEAGYANGFKFTLYATQAGSFTQHRELGEAMAGYWRQIGINTVVIPTDTAWMRPRRNKSPQAPELIGAAETFGGAARAVSVQDLNIWWTQVARITQLSGSVEDIVKRGLAAPSVEEMDKASKEAYNILYNEYRSVPLVYAYTEVWGLGKRIKSIDVLAQRGYIGSSVPSATLAR